MRERRRRRPVSLEMSRYCETIAAELLTWPGVTARRMFGLQLLYRGKAPFVALPDTKDFEGPDFAGFKLLKMTIDDRRVLAADERVMRKEEAKWINFAIRMDADVADFLRWAEKAYQASRT